MKPMLRDAYSAGIANGDSSTERARLRALEKWADPTSRALIEGLAIQTPWHCLEIGAGTGSLSHWLAERCPRGRVVTADMTADTGPGNLESWGSRVPNLEVARIDLMKDDFPAGTFDLIHARLVLAHLPERDAILQRAVQWLKPDGAILVEDAYILPRDDWARDELTDVHHAFLDVLAAQGFDGRWIRRLPSKLANLGIVDLQVVATPVTFGIGDRIEESWSIGFEQFLPRFLRTGVLTLKQIMAYQNLPRTEAIYMPWLLVSVSGRRPDSERANS
ncbi:methyltransferase domain-containing protein [Pendulispora rubella]|uniref:Methyltransferase domain-containing protein n=1 Tax=Pendulispora rubella TaxID=2741070 RepID=A0ABZ2L7X3_9BACT